MSYRLFSSKYKKKVRLSFHQHNICSHLYIFSIFFWIVGIVYHPVYGYFRLLLLYLRIKNARIGRQTGCGRLVVNRLIISEIEIYYLGVIMVITFSASVSRFKSRSIPTGLATLPSGS